MTQIPLENIFGKTAQLTVLREVLKSGPDGTYVSGIAESTGLSHSSVGRVARPLIECGIITERPLGKMIKMLYWNEESKLARDVAEFVCKLEGEN
jgi:DNA-binding transcriptional ArsR family regulator